MARKNIVYRCQRENSELFTFNRFLSKLSKKKEFGLQCIKIRVSMLVLQNLEVLFFEYEQIVVFELI